MFFPLIGGFLKSVHRSWFYNLCWVKGSFSKWEVLNKKPLMIGVEVHYNGRTLGRLASRN
jgi:hypothetical protein